MSGDRNDIRDSVMRAAGIHYALVRGATDTEHLEKWLGFGGSIVASLRHKDGSLAWLVTWNDVWGLGTTTTGGGITVTELSYTHPLVQRSVDDDDDEGEDDEDDEDGEA